MQSEFCVQFSPRTRTEGMKMYQHRDHIAIVVKICVHMLVCIETDGMDLVPAGYYSVE